MFNRVVAYAFVRACSILLMWLLASGAAGQVQVNTYDPVFPPYDPSTAPVVHANGQVTLRLRAPNAGLVKVAYLTPDDIPMDRDADGLWSVTVGPLEPGRYLYLFNIDGVETLDRANFEVITGMIDSINLLEIPGTPPRADQRRDVPHGAVHVRTYRSTVLGMDRRLFLYVPPDYEANTSQRYPVLYLRHGNSGGESTWVTQNRANWILDNLIADGLITPMIVVMPNGFPGPYGEGNGLENFAIVDRELVTDIIPHVDQEYRTLANRESRGIAGWSLGAVQAMYTGVRHVDVFAWIGEFSGGELSRVSFDPSVGFGPLWADPDWANSVLRLLYLATGTEDPRIIGHLNLADALDARGIERELFVTPGGHTPNVAVMALVDFLPRLFVFEVVR